MALLEINYYSETLEMEQSMAVILPELSDNNPDWTLEDLTDIPVLYLLHGMGGNHSTWTRRTSIERYVRNTKIAIVMPSTDLAWYTNTTYGLNYFDALAIELPKKIKQLFPQISTKVEKNFVAGLSMGGYGAWKFAFGTESFSHAASLSGGLVFSKEVAFTLGSETYWKGIFGDLENVEQSSNNLINAARLRLKGGTKPKLYAWCGQEDFLFEASNLAVEQIRQLGYDIDYEVGHGKHEWYYWDKMIERVLEWLPIDYQQEERLQS
ncbi:MAG: esterase family protein [Streptococcaceae bacterium]|jgi:putative tributyrin esterase|nr:esterase family protein [Streptococcaceae bacterium]